MTQKTLVEVSVPQEDGTTLPYGIMNADQAAELCDDTFQKDVAHESSGKEESKTMLETI
jgi:hypothetical protein